MQIDTAFNNSQNDRTSEAYGLMLNLERDTSFKKSDIY